MTFAGWASERACGDGWTEKQETQLPRVTFVHGVEKKEEEKLMAKKAQKTMNIELKCTQDDADVDLDGPWWKFSV